MTDHIKAARSIWGESAILPFSELERFYAIAYRQGMERAAEIRDRLAGVTAKWPEASEGLTAETKFVRGVGDCMATFGEEIRAALMHKISQKMYMTPATCLKIEGN